MNPFPLSSLAARLFEETREVLPRLSLVAKRPSSSALLRKLTGLVLGGILLPGCAQISLREAMDRVQQRYVILMDELEMGGSNFKTRDAATALRKALVAEEIAKESPQAGDPEFQRLLEEAVASTEHLQREAARFDTEALLKIRSEISACCQSCHERYRFPDGK